MLTTSSCQGDEGERAEIGFQDSQHLLRWLRFLSVLAPEDDGDPEDELGFSKLYYRMAPWELVTHSHPDRWGYACRVLREEPGGQVYLEQHADR